MPVILITNDKDDVGRLAAMENRLSAMSQALRMTETALNKFYGALSDEQKAQFDRMSIRSA